MVEKGEYVLNAEISWLVCKDICVPEKVSISEPILISNETVFTNQSSSIQERIIKRNFKSVQAVYSVKPGKVIIDIPLTHSEIGNNAYFFLTIKYL